MGSGLDRAAPASDRVPCRGNDKADRLRLSALSCPSWARTRTLLIQSQTCCQLHQGAVLPLAWAKRERTRKLTLSGVPFKPCLARKPLRHTYLVTRMGTARRYRYRRFGFRFPDPAGPERNRNGGVQPAHAQP